MRSHLIGDEHFYGFVRHIKDLCRLWCSTEVFRFKLRIKCCNDQLNPPPKAVIRYDIIKQFQKHLTRLYQQGANSVRIGTYEIVGGVG